MTGMFEKCPLLYIKCSEKLKKKICDIGLGNVFDMKLIERNRLKFKYIKSYNKSIIDLDSSFENNIDIFNVFFNLNN